jgi:hypothetical protein
MQKSRQNFVLVAFFKEHSANDSAISLRHFFQDFAHPFLPSWMKQAGSHAKAREADSQSESDLKPV